jgi:hypothetical protein
LVNAGKDFNVYGKGGDDAALALDGGRVIQNKAHSTYTFYTPYTGEFRQ